MTYQMLGTDADYTTCDNCGKSNLKKTVVLQDVETKDVVKFGVNCAAAALGYSKGRVDGTAEAVEAIKFHLNRGVDPDRIVKWAWTRFGFGIERKGDVIMFWAEKPALKIQVPAGK